MPTGNYAYNQRIFLKAIKKMSLEIKIRELIAEKLRIDIDKVVPEATFINDLGADSLDLFELVMDLEDEFEVQISQKDTDKLFSVRDIVNYIETRS